MKYLLLTTVVLLALFTTSCDQKAEIEKPSITVTYDDYVNYINAMSDDEFKEAFPDLKRGKGKSICGNCAAVFRMIWDACQAYGNSFDNETFEDFNGHFSACMRGVATE